MMVFDNIDLVFFTIFFGNYTIIIQLLHNNFPWTIKTIFLVPFIMYSFKEI